MRIMIRQAAPQLAAWALLHAARETRTSPPPYVFLLVLYTNLVQKNLDHGFVPNRNSACDFQTSRSRKLFNFFFGRTTRFRSVEEIRRNARSAPLPPAQGDEADVEAETIECMLFYTHL